MNSFPWEVVGVVWLSALGGGIIPLLLKLDETYLHHLVALGTGLLVSIIFFYMLPEALRSPDSTIPVLVGLLGIFVIEYVLVPRTVGHNGEIVSRHSIVGTTAYLGLSLHALTDGFALALALTDPTVKTLLMGVMSVHKFSEAFSLSSVLLLTPVSPLRRRVLIVAFSLVTPLGMMLGALGVQFFIHRLEEWAVGLSSGTFLYIIMCDLLPEVFHHPRRRNLNFLLLLIGISLGMAYLSLGGHLRTH